MKRSIVAVAALLFGTAAYAYQVTGPVLDVTDSKIVVEKGKEKWEIARDKDTKGAKDIKKGDRVTIQYTMTAADIENQTPAKKDDKAKSAKKDEAAKKDEKAKK